MENRTTTTTVSAVEKDSATNSSGPDNAPSGFILKLWSMVNGAPDEVITWTPKGDAFIIGSDLQRLESETLPQYFRHSRFQSLVRQLNFYSFRKINRERNVWVYKHPLFQRDHPETLYRVRRRTCPGVDGRKQRFSRLMADKLNQGVSENNARDADLASTSEDDSVEDQQPQQSHLNTASPNMLNLVRRLPSSSSSSTKVVNAPASAASIVPESYETTPEVNNMEAVTSMVTYSATSSPTRVRDSIFEVSDSADDNSSSETKCRSNELRHSLVVTEVADKLEAYVKRVMKERGITRTRRSGFVTPPFGSSFTMTSRDLITYDDEYKESSNNATGSAIVSGNNSCPSPGKEKPAIVVEKEMLVAPVVDFETVKRISSSIIDLGKTTSNGRTHSEAFRACANVAAFIMCTPPLEQSDQCCSKILQLLSTSNKLESEFYFYRSALCPDLFPHIHHQRYHGIAKIGCNGFTASHSAALRNSLIGHAGKLSALSEFKVFALNLISKFFHRTETFSGIEPLPKPDHAILSQSVKIWARSIGKGV